MEQLKKFFKIIVDLFSRIVVVAKPVVRFLKKFLIYIFNLIVGLIAAAAQPIVQIARKHPIAFFFAVIFHISLIFGLFYANVEGWEMPTKVSGTQQSADRKSVV